MSEKKKKVIPGQDQLFSKRESPKSVVLLIGPSGSGKTAYGIQFLREGMTAGDRCLYINCSQALTAERFESYSTKSTMTIDPIFVSLFTVRPDLDQIASLPDLLERIKRVVQNGGSTTRIMLDSLTDLTARFQIDEVQKFVAELYDLKRNYSTGLFAVTGAPSTPLIDSFGSLVDGIIQLRMDDSGDEIERSIRILSLKTAESAPKWVKFKITQEGFFQFEDTNVTQPDLTCKLCNEPIAGTPAKSESGTFHPHCLDTYQKLGAIYGHLCTAAWRC
jgi:circadian clock protein KaiC